MLWLISCFLSLLLWFRCFINHPLICRVSVSVATVNRPQPPYGSHCSCSIPSQFTTPVPELSLAIWPLTDQQQRPDGCWLRHAGQYWPSLAGRWPPWCCIETQPCWHWFRAMLHNLKLFEVWCFFSFNENADTAVRSFLSVHNSRLQLVTFMFVELWFESNPS